jgi:hypothetical protein
MLFPHLTQARGVAAADPLADGEASDVSAGGLDDFAGGDDFFDGVFGVVSENGK